jgi:hypothetical protein
MTHPGILDKPVLWESNIRFNFERSPKTRHRDSAPFRMRMNLRTEECRKRAAECAEKALCAPDQEVRRTFAELAEQWRTLAEHTEYLGRYH